MANVNGMLVNNELNSDRDVDLTDVYCEDDSSKGDAIELKPNADDTDQTRAANAGGKPDGLNDVNVSVDSQTGKYLIYGVNDSPPLHVTVVCALQQALLSLSNQLIVSLLVSEAVCASHNDVFKAKLLSSTLFMSGVTTVCQNLFGIRLPLFQGAASEYVVPLLLMASTDDSFCNSKNEPSGITTNQSKGLVGANASMLGSVGDLDVEIGMDRILNNVRMIQGSLIMAGFVHAMLGFTGLMGLLLRFVGPLTIVPTLILIFIFLVGPVLKFVEANWGIALSTIAVAVVMFLYLAKYNMPVPVWTPSLGFRIIRYPLHQVFAILISIILNWMLCGALTYAGVLTDDKTSVGYNTRTDSRIQVIYDNPWFTFPYPGQFGAFSFNGAAFLSCMIATLISVLDSIGDYYACARVCRVPAPPKHAVNRGIMIEGLCSMISGTVGCGHATSTYGGNIGAIGVTKVASRHVFVCTGIIYIFFGIFGKFSALFISIPYPVLGGAIIVMFGIFFGVVISNLEVTNMSSPRNIAILGLSVFIGLCVPTWAQKGKNPVQTGHLVFDKIMSMLLGNPNLIGTVIAFVLDNTVPGTPEERGIAAWTVSDADEDAEVDRTLFNEGYDVYRPLMPQCIRFSRLLKYVPFLPYHRGAVEKEMGKNPE
ncbi:solute carrier family 23 member 1-like isoform X2 [Dreissena polymorpha]|uniref:solute carrier family 23 member 1-like isoform X2 n=1 Tax=Dreissena polymorpha TaxID=45954 RepID=UPI002265064F|nr:solute carrier family 23 member 1-like isoform X2 [Dreissena polymorpha]